MSVLDGKPNRWLETAQEASSAPQLQNIDELLATIEPDVTTKQKSPKYSFSRSLARSIGIVPALVLRFLGWKVSNLKNVHDNRRWYYAPYREIAAKYPFLSEITIYRAINALETLELIETGNYNRRKADRTTWFSVTEANINASDSDLIYFSPEVANQVGLKAAVVYEHLQYTSRNKPEALRAGWLRVWPCELAEVQPLTKREIRSALHQLIFKGFLIKNNAEPTGCYYQLGPKASISGVYGFEATPTENEARVPLF